jgi:hypothetical protein
MIAGAEVNVGGVLALPPPPPPPPAPPPPPPQAASNVAKAAIIAQVSEVLIGTLPGNTFASPFAKLRHPEGTVPAVRE